MLKTIFVDGDKGGVGKSLVARALADMYLYDSRHAWRDVVVFDADRSNPDVCGEGGYQTGMISKLISTNLINLETESGWSEFGDAMEQYVGEGRDADIRVIISMPAQIGPRAFDGSIPLVGEILRSVNAIPVWVMSRTQDCITALEARRKAMASHYAHGLVVQNLFFGAADMFTAAVVKLSVTSDFQFPRIPASPRCDHDLGSIRGYQRDSSCGNFQTSAPGGEPWPWCRRGIACSGVIGHSNGATQGRPYGDTSNGPKWALKRGQEWAIFAPFTSRDLGGFSGRSGSALGARKLSPFRISR